MHIKKYDHNFSRRHFLETVSKGALGAGVLTPLWPLISNAQDITKAYPDELLSIEGYTKGKVSTGDMITADNVEYVKDLLDPIAYIEVKDMGRQIKIVKSTTDVTKLFPHEYLEATLRNQGKAQLDENGNVITARRVTLDWRQPLSRREDRIGGVREPHVELGASRPGALRD